MSITKQTWWRPATAGALFALAAIAFWLAATGSTQAGGTGAVSINPALAEVGPGGQTTVSVVVDPPAETLAIWIIEIAYDPEVVQVAQAGGNPVCDPLDVDPGVAGVGGCATKDTGGTPDHDTAVAFGGWVENVGGNAVGLDTTMTVATFTFEAVGDIGEMSPLTVTVTDFLGPDAQEPVPTEADGQINIIEVVGEQEIWGDTDCGGAFNIGDAINVARKQVNLPVNQTDPCPELGTNATVDGEQRIWVDTDCGGAFNIGDAINIARKQINLPVNKAEGCPELGDIVVVS